MNTNTNTDNPGAPLDRQTLIQILSAADLLGDYEIDIAERIIEECDELHADGVRDYIECMDFSLIHTSEIAEFYQRAPWHVDEKIEYGPARSVAEAVNLAIYDMAVEVAEAIADYLEAQACMEDEDESDDE